MSGHSDEEYQFHYWALVGKLTIDDESISIAVPLVMFNYPQKVTSGSVDFDLKEVEDMSNQTRELAELKAKELSDFINEITETVGVQEWTIVPTMTCHKHPGRMNSFSGTDYCKDLDEPGICHPLSIGVNQPSFSSIVCHTGGVAELVHTEFRLFNGDDDKKEYTYGTCMTYVKAAPEEKSEQSIVDSVLMRNIPKDNKPYYLKDRLPGNEGTEFLMEIATIFEKTDFEVETSLIIEKNVEKAYSNWGNNRPAKGSYWERYYDQQDAVDSDEPEKTIYTATRMKQDLVDSGLYTYPELYMINNLEELHDALLAMNDEADVVEEDNEEALDKKQRDERDKMVHEMLQSGIYRVHQFAGLSYEDIDTIYTEFLKDD